MLSLTHRDDDPMRELIPPLWVCSLGLVGVVSLLLSPGRTRFFLFLPITTAIVLYTPYIRTATHLQDYSTGCNIAHCFLLWVDRLLLSDAERDFYHVRGPSARDPASPLSPPPFDSWTAKLRWSGGLWVQMRGVGWSWQVNGVPPALPATYPRWRFVARNIAYGLFVVYVPMDVLQTIFQRSLPGKAARAGAFLELPFVTQAVYTWAYFIFTYLGLEASYSLGIVLSVASGLCTPEDCPPLWGPLSEIYTLSRAWGRFWHGLLRRIASSYSRTVAYRLLGCRKGSALSRLTQIWVGFAVSGAVHCFGAYTLVRHDMGQAKFFLIQPCGIMLEEVVIMVGGRLGIQGGARIRCLGYLWVIAWFTWWTREVMDGLAAAKIWSDEVVPPSGAGDWLFRQLSL